MISKQEQRAESDYLKSVLYVLGKEIEKKESVKDQIEGDIKVAMKYIWEEGSTEADDFINIHESIRQLNRGVLQSDKTLKAYRRMLSSAYFARIDFDDGTEVLPIYLGIASLKDGSEFYVYDWRAPICSPFYDAEIGEASYTLPDGTEIKGKITLKRQYKVEGDKILEIFDTNTQVVDNVLSKLLSTTGSTKMRNIVATIQKEQNKIIRKQDIDILAVQGPAGSGKTSVALHRIAYLLYADKENLNKSNMLILSPNEAFSDYISDVLPQMGEDNVYQTTFYDYVQAYTREFKIKSNMNDIYEELFVNQKTPFFKSIRFKFWPGYIKLLENYLEESKFKLLGIDEDIVLDGELMANCEFLARYVENNLSNSTMRIYEQAKLVNEKILSIAGVRLVKNSKGKAKLEKMLKANLKKIRAKSIYTELYGDLNKFTERVQNIYNELGTIKQERLSIKDLKEIFDYTQDLLNKNIIPYEDVMAYLYMKERVTGTVTQTGIKQVVIDEAQDYSLVQYKLISNVFRNAQITILGDLNQSIMPFVNYTNYDSILSVLKEDRVHSKIETQYLTKTYRSTVEISTFANKVIGAETTPIKNQLDRHGEEVKVFQDVSSGDKSLIVKHAKELKTEDNTVAIIFKTAKECKDFQKSLGRTSASKQFTFMVDGNNDFVNNKIMVLPLYMAKGLEFDVVLIPRANEDNYNKKNKKLFYVASTRAMNTLRIYYDEVPSSLIL